MNKPARLLLADIQTGQILLRSALVGYECFSAGTFAEGMRLMKEDGFDMVICGVHFDDSRMLEFFQEIRKQPDHAKTKLIAFRAGGTELRTVLRDSINIVRNVLHLSAYIEWEDHSSSTSPVDSLRCAIEEFIPLEQRVQPETILLERTATDP
jgi:hypothetical protein